MKVEIKNSDGKMVFVEVSEEVYAVLQEEKKSKSDREMKEEDTLIVEN